MSLPLNKEVCKSCRNSSIHLHSQKWGKNEDYFWDMKGVVDCPYGVHGLADNQYLTMRLGQDPIPSCPYYMEHVVSDVKINHGPFHEAFGKKIMDELDAQIMKDLSC